MNGNSTRVGLDTEYVRGSELDDSVPDDDNAVVSTRRVRGQKKSGVIPTEGLSRRNRLSCAASYELSPQQMPKA